MNWVDYFYYDESSPTCLRWAVTRRSGRNRVMARIGDTAGCLREPKAAQVQLAGRQYFCHRVIWEMHNGAIPDGRVIDHINGDAKDNRLANLRLVTQAVNSRNQRKPRNNTSKVTGVTRVTPNGGEYWKAFWREGGKVKSKQFSIRKLGEEEAFRLACEHRSKKIQELNSAGAGYTERHGK